MITWKYNRYGHVEVWQGTEMKGESDLYIQADYDVEAFFNQIGFNMDQIDIGDFDTCEDPGYFA